MNTRWRAVRTGLGLGLILVIAGGCASWERDISYLRLPDDANPQQEIAFLNQQIALDRREQVDFFAPDSFATAMGALKQAQVTPGPGNTEAQIRDNIAKSKGYLGLAELRARQVKNVMGTVVVAREQAMKLGSVAANSSFSKAEAELAQYSRDSDTPRGVLPVTDSKRAELLRQYLSTGGVPAN